MELDIIYNQDCLEGMKSLPGECIDLVITSPPYDNLRDYNNSSVWTFDIFKNIGKEIYRVMKSGGVLVWIVNDATIQKSESGSSFKQALYFKECGFLIHDTMIWKKISPFQHKNRYIQSFEYMFILSKKYPPKTANLICDRKNKWAGTQVHGSARYKNGETRKLSAVQTAKIIKEYGARFNIWEISTANNRTGHPAPFPLQLATDHIISWSNENDIVLDPFLGSGTTAAAAYNTNRRYIGFEIDSQYCGIARKRLDELETEKDLITKSP